MKPQSIDNHNRHLVITNNDLKKQNTPNFKGLYFRTPEVKEVVSRMPKFVEFLKKDS